MPSAGSSKAIRAPTIATTTNISINVNPARVDSALRLTGFIFSKLIVIESALRPFLFVDENSCDNVTAVGQLRPARTKKQDWSDRIAWHCAGGASSGTSRALQPRVQSQNVGGGSIAWQP